MGRSLVGVVSLVTWFTPIEGSRYSASESNENFILPKTRKNEVVSFVKSGLKDLSISRKSFSWGIQVPSNKNHVIYVIKWSISIRADQSHT